MKTFISDGVNIYKINLIKNAFQYSVGAVLYFTFFSDFSIMKFFLGLIGFLIAYQSVYYFNDVMDYKEDKRDKIRKHYKHLVTGKNNTSNLVSYTFLFLIIGLPICFSVSISFGVLVSIILFLNFLHSSNFVKLKKSKLLLPNLFFIELIKYSLGWFSLTFTLEKFPSLLMISLSLFYVTAYLYYRQNVTNFFRNLKIRILSVASILSYIVCIFVYPFKLPLLLPVPVALFYIVFKKYNSLQKINVGANLTFLMAIFFLVSMLVLSIPSVAELNEEISTHVDIVKENITEMVPIHIKMDIENIQEKINEININVGNFVERVT